MKVCKYVRIVIYTLYTCFDRFDSMIACYIVACNCKYNMIYIIHATILTLYSSTSKTIIYTSNNKTMLLNITFTIDYTEKNVKITNILFYNKIHTILLFINIYDNNEL